MLLKEFTSTNLDMTPCGFDYKRARRKQSKTESNIKDISPLGHLSFWTEIKTLVFGCSIVVCNACDANHVSDTGTNSVVSPNCYFEGQQRLEREFCTCTWLDDQPLFGK